MKAYLIDAYNKLIAFTLHSCHISFKITGENGQASGGNNAEIRHIFLIIIENHGCLQEVYGCEELSWMMGVEVYDASL